MNINFKIIAIINNEKNLKNVLEFILKYPSIKICIMLRDVNHNQFDLEKLIEIYFQKYYLNVPLIVNSFSNYRADFLHVNSYQLNDKNFMNNLNLKFGASCHNINDVQIAEKYKAEYLTYSPIFTTQSHLNTNGKGISKLKLIVDYTKIKVFALGGISVSNIKKCFEVGCYGVASISFFDNSISLEKEVIDLLSDCN